MTVVVKSVESRTVGGLTDFKFLFFLQKFQRGLLILGKNKLINAKTFKLVGDVFANILFEVVDVILSVKSGHFFFAGMAGMVHVQFPKMGSNLLVKSSINDEIMRHGDSLRPHGMFLGINKFADDGVVKVSNFFVCRIVFQIHTKYLYYDMLTNHSKL